MSSRGDYSGCAFPAVSTLALLFSHHHPAAALHPEFSPGPSTVGTDRSRRHSSFLQGMDGLLEGIRKAKHKFICLFHEHYLSIYLIGTK